HRAGGGARVGKPEREGRPRAHFALDREIAFHHARQAAADGEAEAGAAMRPRIPARTLHERLEDGADLIGRNSGAGVAHDDARPGRAAPAVRFGAEATALAMIALDRHSAAR